MNECIVAQFLTHCVYIMLCYKNILCLRHNEIYLSMYSCSSGHSILTIRVDITQLLSEVA